MNEYGVSQYVRNDHQSLRNNSEERSPQQLGGGSLKLRNASTH